MSRNYTLPGLGVRASRLLAVALCVIFAAAQAPAQRNPIPTISGGQLAIALDASFIRAIRTSGITLVRTRPGAFRNGIVTVPISVGSIDRATGHIELVGPGGLTLRSGSNEIQFINFVITITPDEPAVLTAMVIVNGQTFGRIPIFDLVVPPIRLPITPRADGTIRLEGIELRVNQQFASALGTNLGTTVLATGMSVGIATFAVRPGVPGEGF